MHLTLAKKNLFTLSNAGLGSRRGFATIYQVLCNRVKSRP